MKKYIFILTTSLFRLVAFSQIQTDPTHWAYGLKKLSGNTYEVHLQCTIEKDWHIYAQKQTADFIGTATSIAFEKAAGLTLTGKSIEIGKKDTWKDKSVGITNYEYAGKVDFVQKVMIKPGVKEIKGTITYQTCTHQRCLTEKTINFTVPVS